MTNLLSLSAQEQIEYLATKVMGWEKARMEWGDIMFQEKGKKTCYPFEPLRDWNDWRQVEEKVMEDEGLAQAFLDQFVRGDNTHPFTVFYAVARPDLPNRCQALIHAHQLLHD